MSKKESSAKPVSKSAVNAEPVFELDAVVAAVSRAAQAKLEQKEGGIFKHADKDTYAEALAEAGLDIKVSKQYQNFDTAFAAGQLHALSEAGIPALQANPNLQSVSLDVKCGNDRLDLSIGRDGVVGAAWTKRGTQTAGSQFGKVSAHISSLVRSQLGAE